MRLSEIQNFKNENGFVEMSSFEELPTNLNGVGYYSKKWIIFEDGKALFKRCSKKGFEQFGQLICSEMLRRLDIVSARYEPAIKDGETEYLLSYCFEEADKKLVNAKTLIKNDSQDTLSNTLDVIDHYIADESSAEKIKIDRIKLFINEVFTLNYDNKAENWGMLHSYGNYEMSPAFDKGMIFRLNMPVLNDGFDEKNLLGNDSLYRFNSGVFSKRQTFDKVISELSEIIFSDSSERTGIYNYKEVILREMCKHSKLDIDDIINEVEKQYKIQIPAVAKERCLKHFSNNKLVFDDILKNYIKKQRGDRMEIKLYWQDILLATLKNENGGYELNLVSENFHEASSKNCPDIYFKILEENEGISEQIPPIFMYFIPQSDRQDIYSLFSKGKKIDLMETLDELSKLGFPEDGLNISRKEPRSSKKY